eukprot:GSA25T00013149001.1
MHESRRTFCHQTGLGRPSSPATMGTSTSEKDESAYRSRQSEETSTSEKDEVWWEMKDSPGEKMKDTTSRSSTSSLIRWLDSAYQRVGRRVRRWLRFLASRHLLEQHLRQRHESIMVTSEYTQEAPDPRTGIRPPPYPERLNHVKSLFPKWQALNIEPLHFYSQGPVQLQDDHTLSIGPDESKGQQEDNAYALGRQDFETCAFS